ncbi:MAG: ATP-dependent DNA helicase RecG [Tannerellaceae bacterium]
MKLSDRDITYLQGVGPKRGDVLKKEIEVYSFEDLLYYFPYKYIDRSRFYYIHEIDGNMPFIQIRGRFLSFETIGEGRTRRMVAKFSDGRSVIDIVWFKGLNFVTNKLKVNKEYIVFGKPTAFGSKYNIAHPDVDPIEEADKVAAGLTPFYNTTEKMKSNYLNSKAIQTLEFTLFQTLQWRFDETLTPAVINRAKVIDLSSALKGIHFPESTRQLNDAQFRLKFEELFFIQLNILRYTKQRQAKLKGVVFTRVGEIFHHFYEKNLPFTLTNAQKRVVKEIRKDMGGGKQMNRLVQGDVGSGKTLVALLCMLIALDNGFQACLMAPTEILANQHYETIREFLKGMDVNVRLLTGSTKKKERNELFPALEKGEIQILIGTHALIEDTVNFHRLGLVVIDEQHRFGVAQRAKLWTKATEVPHILVMTATPIPRTLAMTLYGDLDVSVIDELPPGRKPIQTEHRYDNKRASLYKFLESEITKGRQVYIVYPLIEENEKLDYKNLESGFETMKEVFPQFNVSMVHGRMKPAEKDFEMQKFASGESQILLATTVIEVGVNVPNASVMVIESAERFGLSQLHQLRGRVGRGAEQSYCILISSHKLSNDTRKRLEIMVNSTDGFEIAEADLKLRGPGDLEGTQQSGLPVSLKIADLAADGQVLQLARDIAFEVLDDDPDLSKPHNRLLALRLNHLFAKKINWGLIS